MPTNSPMTDLGFGPSFAEAAQTSKATGSAYRVVAQHRGQLRVSDGSHEGWAHVRGRPTGPDAPAIGDWVMVQFDDPTEPGAINEILPRRTAFSRRSPGKVEEQIVAANIDIVFIVNGLDGDFNPKRVERYLVATWQSGATPVILLNKSDLSKRVPQQLAQTKEVAGNAEVHVLSALLGEGVDVIRSYLSPGVTLAFLGSSGAGKSTIINQLLGGEVQATGGLRADDRGRHTTTHRELFQIPSGGLVIDTPGLREIQLWHADEGLSATFGDIEDLVGQCRYRDCHHQTEDGCAIQEALSAGRINHKRYERYLKLKGEIEATRVEVDRGRRKGRKPRR